MNLHDSIVKPFLKALPWILEHPDSKRLPKGFRFGKVRQGRTSLEVFCEEWKFICQEWPKLITSEDCEAMDAAFDLLAERERA